MAAPVKRDGTAPEHVDMTWPGALKQCLDEHHRFRAEPRAHLSAERQDLKDSQLQNRR